MLSNISFKRILSRAEKLLEVIRVDFGRQVCCRANLSITRNDGKEP
jgi:hypothetical protein